MRVSITVKPNCKKPRVEECEDGSYLVAVSAPAQDGKANRAVIEALAKFFKVSKSEVTILRGTRGKKKLVEIN